MNLQTLFQLSHQRRYALLAALVVVGAILFLPLVIPFAGGEDDRCVYVVEGEPRDTTLAHLSEASGPMRMMWIRLLTSGDFCSGRYRIGGTSTFGVWRALRGGRQMPVQFTVPLVRTTHDLAVRLSEVFAPSRADFEAALSDSTLCQKYGLTPQTIITLFVPNTYELYWTTTPEELLERMQRESSAFWTEERLSQASAAGLTPAEVITLASIVEQESSYNPEKPMIAGMYLNRLHQGMRLQADPTVKFAVGDPTLRRILNVHLQTPSPYNTYRHEGLPPGPICIPSVASIEAVLNFAHHDYLYMCAKEDLSGSHRFAATGEEHMANARRYADALDSRGIK